MSEITQRLVRAPNVLAQDLDDEVLLLPPQSAHALHLDRVAAGVWRLLEEPVTIGEIAAAISEAYAVPQETALADVGPALEMLLAHGAAVVAP